MSSNEAKAYTDEELEGVRLVIQGSPQHAPPTLIAARVFVTVEALQARVVEAEKAYEDALAMHLDTANHAKVVCGDHWHGLSGESVDGSDGCPWCIAAEREARVAEVDELLGDEQDSHGSGLSAVWSKFKAEESRASALQVELEEAKSLISQARYSVVHDGDIGGSLLLKIDTFMLPTPAPAPPSAVEVAKAKFYEAARRDHEVVVSWFTHMDSYKRLTSSRAKSDAYDALVLAESAAGEGER